jgi:hypothetical protein
MRRSVSALTLPSINIEDMYLVATQQRNSPGGKNIMLLMGMCCADATESE